MRRAFIRKLAILLSLAAVVGTEGAVEAPKATAVTNETSSSNTGGAATTMPAALTAPSPSAVPDLTDAGRTASTQTMENLNDKRPLSIGDRVSFMVLEDESSPYPAVVTDSGEMEVPYIGRVMANQKTCKQLAYYVKSILEKEYYYQATVLIGLDSAGSKVSSRGKVYVVGQVRSQGPQEIPLDEVWTVSKAVLRAGGFLPYANKRKVKLVRGGSGGGDTETVIVDLVEVLEKGQTRKDPEVGPDDLVVVPEKLINF